MVIVGFYVNVMFMAISHTLPIDPGNDPIHIGRNLFVSSYYVTLCFLSMKTSILYTDLIGAIACMKSLTENLP